MAFPFTITSSKSFDRILTKDEVEQALLYVDGFIRNKSAKNVLVVDNCIFYKGSTSAFNWNIFNAVDRGMFKITDKGDKSIITYEFFMYHLFIFVSIAAVISGLYMMSIWPPIMCIGWLGGMNWIIAATRHTGMLDEIKDGIDAQLRFVIDDAQENDIDTTKDDQPEKLKSWF